MIDVEFNTGSPAYLRSEFTINFVLSSFYHRVLRRCEFLKSLTILINIICRFYENLDVTRELSEQINIKYFKSIMSYLNGYEYLKWLNGIYPSFVTKGELDKNVRRIIDLIDNNSEESLNEMKQTSQYDNVLIKSFILSFRNKKMFDVNSIGSARNLLRFNEISNYLIMNVFRAV